MTESATPALLYVLRCWVPIQAAVMQLLSDGWEKIQALTDKIQLSNFPAHELQFERQPAQGLGCPLRASPTS